MSAAERRAMIAAKRAADAAAMTSGAA